MSMYQVHGLIKRVSHFDFWTLLNWKFT